MILAFDTETTGLPEWKLPSDDPSQPHVIQFAGILLDGQGNEVDVLSTLVKPRRDATMHPLAYEAHGISLQQAYDEGIEATALLDWFMDAIGKVGLIIGHNVQFDVRLMRILSARWRGVKWDNPHPLFCTMKRSTALVNLPPTAKMIAVGRTNPKPPKLSEAYEHFFGDALEGAHDALVDVRASVRVFNHLVKELGVRI
jgi:DNA polymerase-3 subunit epsilon